MALDRGISTAATSGFTKPSAAAPTAPILYAIDLTWFNRIGVVNGLLPCSLVYAALAVSVAVGHPVWGALAMVAFGFGTVPTLSVIALGVRRIVARDIRVRRLVAAGVLAAGLWSIGLRQGILGEHTMNHGGGDDHSQMQHQMEPADSGH